MLLQCIYRSLATYLRKKNMKSLRNFYIQMDNTNSNKSVELLNGLAALVLLDVCQKIKVSYLTVGHTHNDDDGAIGVAGNHMCAANIESLSRCDALLMESFEDIQSTNTFVEEIVSITDYGKILCDRSSKNPFSINGMIYCY